MTQRVFFFDLLRCVAAVAVVAIHVLAPYRELLGVIPFDQWSTAVGINSFSRWAVPVFIMVSGALFLSDTRPFDTHYYLKRRVAKVVVPFVVWSLFYAYLSGWSASGFDAETSYQVLSDFFHHETYYHLGFFYYFIPLYFVIPFLQYLVKVSDSVSLYALISLWLLTTAFYLFGVSGPWSNQIYLYSGYLLLGYLCYQRMEVTSNIALSVFIIGMVSLAVTALMVMMGSVEAKHYTFGLWLSYKTLNTALAAMMVFILCRYFADRLSGKTVAIVSFISRYSLGIYLLHPVFLWPMKAYGWHQGHPIWVIPLWVVLSGGGALALSWLLARSAKTRWLLP
ncbi:acyltransferase [Vibrio gangliei]|uniref:acyltransferase n=1 Tax=Vibrio gangliei TaxID=2077090 RepID=UPI000D01E4B7|nr:acyltransferase family protein [Vibrio gangliei]